MPPRGEEHSDEKHHHRAPSPVLAHAHTIRISIRERNRAFKGFLSVLSFGCARYTMLPRMLYLFCFLLPRLRFNGAKTATLLCAAVVLVAKCNLFRPERAGRLPKKQTESIPPPVPSSSTLQQQQQQQYGFSACKNVSSFVTCPGYC